MFENMIDLMLKGELPEWDGEKLARRQAVDVKTLMRDVVISAQISTGRPEASIPVSGDNVQASADPDMLRAALLNLTLNACQVAPNKEVEVRIAACDGVCRIGVYDRGPGNLVATVRFRSGVVQSITYGRQPR